MLQCSACFARDLLLSDRLSRGTSYAQPSIIGPLIAVHDQVGLVLAQMGSALPPSVPKDTFMRSDRWWQAISVSSELVVRRLLSLLGIETDPRFQSLADRIDSRQKVDETVAHWASDRAQEQILRELAGADIASAPVCTVRGPSNPACELGRWRPEDRGNIGSLCSPLSRVIRAP